MNFENDDEELGYTVFKRSDSGTYGVRFTLQNNDGKTLPQIRIGLRTKIEAMAYKRAAKAYLNAQVRLENNMLVGSTSFSNVAKDYLRKMESEIDDDPKKLAYFKRDKVTLERFFMKKFKDKPVTMPFEAEFEDYIKWRIKYWTTGPGKKDPAKKRTYLRNGVEVEHKIIKKEASISTLKRENGILRAVFKHAVRMGLMRRGDIPTFDLPKFEQNKRLAFTKEQYHKIVATAEQRLLEANNIQIDEIDDVKRQRALQRKERLRYERNQMFHFITVAAETGMRPVEMFNLKWGHIEGLEKARNTKVSKTTLILSAHGKGKKLQRFVPRRDAISSLLSIWDGAIKQFGVEPDNDDTVFRDYLGRPIKTLNRNLNQLLEAAGTLYSTSGPNEKREKFSTYSFRHSYATWSREKDPPVDVYTLASNMRTSVEMIEKWYDNADVVSQASTLLGDDEW